MHAVPQKGRPLIGSPPVPLAVRALEEGECPSPAPLAPIKEARTRHHAVARCLAKGLSAGETALATGYTPQQITNLQKDGLFKDLLTFYKQKSIDAFEATEEALAGLTSEAIAEIRNRLELAPEAIANRDLLELVKLSADRSGHGPQATQVNVDLNLSERMKHARQRRDALQGEVIK